MEVVPCSRVSLKLYNLHHTRSDSYRRNYVFRYIRRPWLFPCIHGARACAYMVLVRACPSWALASAGTDCAKGFVAVSMNERRFVAALFAVLDGCAPELAAFCGWLCALLRPPVRSQKRDSLRSMFKDGARPCVANPSAAGHWRELLERPGPRHRPFVDAMFCMEDLQNTTSDRPNVRQNGARRAFSSLVQLSPWQHETACERSFGRGLGHHRLTKNSPSRAPTAPGTIYGRVAGRAFRAIFGSRFDAVLWCHQDGQVGRQDDLQVAKVVCFTLFYHVLVALSMCFRRLAHACARHPFLNQRSFPRLLIRRKATARLWGVSL